MAQKLTTLEPTYQLKRSNNARDSRMPASGMDDVEKLLKEKQQRLSRMSIKLTQQSDASGKNLNLKLKEFEVNQMAQQLQELQEAMKAEERQRRETVARDERFQKEEADLKKKSMILEKRYNEIDPSAKNDVHLSQNTLKRRTALLALKGGINDEEWNQLQKKGMEDEDKERREKMAQQEYTEKKLRDLDSQIRQKEEVKREQDRKLQQQQLMLLEKKLKEMEDGFDKDDGGVQSELDLQREIEKRQRDYKERRERERKERQKLIEEEERIRRDKEDQLLKRRQEMEKKMRDVESMLAEKMREREELLMRKQADKIKAMEDQLKELESGVGLEEEESKFFQMKNNFEYKKMEQQVADLQKQLAAKSGPAPAAALGGAPVNNDVLNMILSKLGEVMGKVDYISQNGVAMGAGGGGHSKNANNAEALKQEIQDLQKILFDPNSTEKEIADANIKLEKAMSDYEKTPECQQEVARAKAEKKAKHEGPNKEALAKLKKIYNPQAVKTNPDLLQKIGESPELRLLFMEPETILKLYQNDFKTFTLRSLTLEELRAIRACLPNFRKDQKIQSDWVETLDDKIEQMSSGGTTTPPPPKKDKPAKAWKAPPPKPASAGGGDIFAELLAKKGQLGEGGQRAAPAAAPPPSQPSPSVSKPALPKMLPPKMPALPPGPGGPPPPAPAPAAPEPVKQAAPTKAAAPAPVAAPSKTAAPSSSGGGDAPPSTSIEQYKKVKMCLEKLLKGLLEASSSEKEIAADTRITVQEVKQLAKLQKAKHPDPCNQIEDVASELVVAVKNVLVAKKTGGSELTAAKGKLAQIIESVRSLALKTLGPNGKDYVGK